MSKQSAPEFHPRFYGPRYWTTWLGLGFFKLLTLLPVWLSFRIGAMIGWLFFHFARPRRRITEVNIALCFPELSVQEQQQLVRNIMRSIGISVVETAIALWGDDKKLIKRCKLVGYENLEPYIKQGQGVLLLGAHLTTLDLAGRLLSHFMSFDVLYRKDPNPLLAYKIAAARGKFANAAIPRNDTRQMIRNLRNGRNVWYAPDQDYGAKYSVFAPFFGVNAATITGSSRIAQISKVPVIPFWHYRTDDGGYELIFEPPLENFPTGDEVADAARINSVIEGAIRRHPEQYLWVHRRFKTRPPGEASFYRKKKK